MTEKTIANPVPTPDANHKRYSQEPFPSYRFIPGINPHPMRDPQGHSYGEPEAALIYSQPDDWQNNNEYLFGVDLYNYAYWWESHEKWEGLWHTTNKDSEHGQFLQGLIQISAAFIKWYLKQPEGLSRLFALGFGRLEFVSKKHPIFMGLNLEHHLNKLERHFTAVIKNPKQWPDLFTDYPFIEFDFD